MGDIREFELPDLGEGLEEGTIVEWHVKAGDSIELDQTVAAIETAKAVVDVPSPYAGEVMETLGEEGDTIAVGAALLRVDVARGQGTGDADVAKPPADRGPVPGEEPQPLVGYGRDKIAASARRRRAGGSGEAGDRQRLPGSPKLLAKPPVRKLAKDLGVDLSTIGPGSGEGGTITREDVHEAAERVGAAPEAATSSSVQHGDEQGNAAASHTLGFRGRSPGQVEPIRGVRKRIVEKMERSRRDIPEATCARTADLTELWGLRGALTEQARQAGADVKITPFALVMRATVLALQRFPTLNARIDREGGEIHLLEHINLGFAADTERGLVVPNIKNAQTKSTLELAMELQELSHSARAGSIAPGDLTGGTFTLSNYGAFGNDDGDPIINHPEAGILGVGAIRERPWVVDGHVQVRRVATFRLAFDHRVCDGGEAGRFVTFIGALCEQPSLMLLHS